MGEHSNTLSRNICVLVISIALLAPTLILA
jgi:hypothetical protein